MTTPQEPDQHAPGDRRIARRREKIRSEVARNREGGHKVPTWVLAVILGVLVFGWLFLVFYFG
ncbi:hypothetical protein AB0J80_35290 [Actinoplanes sp. NPDC049548]|uniref:hypothetical protein n=1 Tax=Actinoplanes sp. NPDC049548 TaxID=3155152 RepID=UPI00342E923E